MRKTALKQTLTISDLIRTNPDYFFQDILGVDLWDIQKQIVNSIRDNRKTSVRSCHSSGKTFCLARAALWFLYAFPPAVVIDTAPTDRQVRNQFWREFRSAHQRAKYNLGGETLKTQFNLDEDWYAFGFSTRDTAGEDVADKFQGFHGKNILIIVDEASGVSESIFQAIDGSLSSGLTVRLVYIGNPTRTEGSFAQSFSDPTFKTFTISAFDTPNFRNNKILTVADLTRENVQRAATKLPGLAEPIWALDMLKKYGSDSDVFRVKVLGQFPKKSSDTFISVDDVQTAINREVPAILEDDDIQEIIGVDVARYGDDEGAIVSRKNDIAEVLEKIQGQDTMVYAGKIKRYLMDRPKAVAHIDSIGIGAGVLDRLLEQPEVSSRCFGVNVATAASNQEHFKNLRAEAWDNLKSWLKYGHLVPHEDWMQIAKPKYKILSSGQIQLESKEDMKKRSIPSPDVADALVLTLATPTEGGDLDVIALGSL